MRNQQKHRVRRDSSSSSDRQMPAEPASPSASCAGACAQGVSVESSDPLDVWRRRVDATLIKLSSVQHSPPALLREVTHLTGHVEALRRHADSSRRVGAIGALTLTHCVTTIMSGGVTRNLPRALMYRCCEACTASPLPPLHLPACVRARARACIVSWTSVFVVSFLP